MIYTKTKILNNYEPKDFICKDALTKAEVSQTWPICILSPVLGGAILYLGWKKKLPFKAKHANKISIMAFMVVLCIYVFYAIITRSLSYL
jgi:hypothetical protein